MLESKCITEESGAFPLYVCCMCNEHVPRLCISKVFISLVLGSGLVFASVYVLRVCLFPLCILMLCISCCFMYLFTFCFCMQQSCLFYDVPGHIAVFHSAKHFVLVNENKLL